MAKPKHIDVHKQLCILSIDDDAVNLLVIEQLLSPEGWRVGFGLCRSDLTFGPSPNRILIRSVF